MSNPSYPPPLDKLLALGDPVQTDQAPRHSATIDIDLSRYHQLASNRDTHRYWPNYLELGLGPEHIPALIRLATDNDLRWADSDDSEVWAPIHAWRALGQLRAEAAIKPLLGLFRGIDDEDDDWAQEEMPEVFGLIGPAAVPALARLLGDDSYDTYARLAASSSLEKIGLRHRSARAACVAAITQVLEGFADQNPSLNGFLISDLVDLDASEALPLIERAFRAEAVDEMVRGDFDRVRKAFGL